MQRKTKKNNNQYGLRWIYAQTKGNRHYLALIIATGAFMALVNIGMTTVLMRFVDIATDDSTILLSQNLIAAIFFWYWRGC